ncbi:ABC transporter substrate-binding protein [Xanthobacter autotrophicus]|uniref:ABC transporter substrate-binding protein n=1 Tax=Xanthobacter autotrophicus TaxID=280 RepID=UPI001E302540|nr:ABC transporter substrate-binding protein [Xanthobacter autotrophicus]UDQ91065.1 ABC transporter substrate-binding protein [Xanthobacter autotrophicus]
MIPPFGLSRSASPVDTHTNVTQPQGKMMRLRHCLYAGLALAASTLLVRETRAQEPIRLPMITPLTGSIAVLGQDSKKAAEVAQDIINAAGGIGGRPLQLEIVDTQGRPEIARREMERLTREGRAPVVLACDISAGTSGAAQFAESAQVPLLNGSAVSADILARGYKWYFSHQMSSDDEAATAFAYMKTATGAKPLAERRIALLYEDSPRGAGTGERLRKLMDANGVKVVSETTYNRADRNLLPVMRKVQDSTPELVIWIGYTEDVVAGMKAARQLDFKPYVLGIGGGMGDPRLPELVDPAIIEQLHVVNVDYFNPDIKRAAAFRNAYLEKFGTEPSSYAGTCYAAIFTLKAALEAALKASPDLTTTSMRDAFRKLDIPGDQTVTSFRSIRFDPTNGRNLGAEDLVAAWVDGKRKVTVFPPSIAVGKPVMLP